MDHILSSKQFKPAQIRRLNYCRLRLQSVTISDVTTNSGLTLDSMSTREGLLSLDSSVTQNVRVNQDRPSDAEWKLLKKANLLWSASDETLKHPLGSWLYPIATQRQRNFAYLLGGTLAIRFGTSYHLHRRRRGLFHFSGTSIPFVDLPHDASPTDVMYHTLIDEWIPYPHQSGPFVPIQNPPISATFVNFIQTLAAWESDLLYHPTMSIVTYSVCKALAHGFCAVSNGSVRYNSQGSFGWVLCTSDGEQVVPCMGPALGQQPTSFRAEGYGLLSFLLFLRRVSEFTFMLNPWIGTIATDSESLLKTLKGPARSHLSPSTEAPLRIAGDSTTLDPFSRTGTS
jgi:hypothetical protein